MRLTKRTWPKWRCDLYWWRWRRHYGVKEPVGRYLVPPPAVSKEAKERFERRVKQLRAQGRLP